MNLLFLIAKAVNLIGDILVVDLGVGQLHKLRLQLCKAVVDVAQGFIVIHTEDSGDVILQGGKERFLPTQCIVDGGDHHVLDVAFQHRPGVAEQAGILQATNASPDDGSLAPVVPMDPAEYLSAAPADDHLSETMVAAEGSVLPVRAGVDDTPPDQLFLHLHENFTRDNGLMAVFNVVLRDKSVVFDPRFREEVSGVCFLQKGIADVLLISQDVVNVAGMPFFPACSVSDYEEIQDRLPT